MILLTVNDLWNKILKVGHQVTNHPVYGWTLKSLHFFYVVRALKELFSMQCSELIGCKTSWKTRILICVVYIMKGI